MGAYRARIEVGLATDDLIDPEGNSTAASLQLLGFSNVERVRTAKVYSVDLTAESREEALQKAEAMAQRFLANPVSQRAKIEVYDRNAGGK